jgi:hypothetical protein
MASSPSDHTVLVLGAGASLAEAISHHPKRDRHHPPLDRNFFMRASRRIGLEPQDSERRALLDRVVERASALGERDLCGSNPPVSLEEYLGRLYFDMSTAANDTNIASYYDLIRLSKRSSPTPPSGPTSRTDYPLGGVETSRNVRPLQTGRPSCGRCPQEAFKSGERMLPQTRGTDT